MNEQNVVSQKRGLKSWTTRDLLVVAVINIVFTIIMTGINYVSTILLAFNPAVVGILAGFFFIQMIMTMYIVRRPGACILATLVYGLASAPFHPYGWAMAFSSVIFGVAAEIPFFISRYRNYKLYLLMISGVTGCLLSYLMVALYSGYSSLTVWMQVVTALVYMASGALVGGWLSKLLSDALVKTGVLSGFAISQEVEEI